MISFMIIKQSFGTSITKAVPMGCHIMDAMFWKISMSLAWEVERIFLTFSLSGLLITVPLLKIVWGLPIAVKQPCILQPLAQGHAMPDADFTSSHEFTTHGVSMMNIFWHIEISSKHIVWGKEFWIKNCLPKHHTLIRSLGRTHTNHTECLLI